MKKISLFLLAALCCFSLLTLSACTIDKQQSGDLVTKTFDNFEGVNAFSVQYLHVRINDLDDGPDVNIVMDGGAPAVEISMQESMFSSVSVTRSGSDLVVKGNRNYRYLTDHKVTITVKNLVFSRLNFSNACRVNADSACLNASSLVLSMSGASAFRTDKILSDDLELDISGASRIVTTTAQCQNLDVDCSGASLFSTESLSCNNAEFDISGASRVAIDAGNCPTVDVDASGASSFHAETLVADNAKIEASGASNVRITANAKLTGKLSGASTLYYNGSAECSVSTSGGSVVRKGE